MEISNLVAHEWKCSAWFYFFFPSAEWRSNGGGDREREKCRERERERERERVRRQTFLGLEISLECNKLG